MSILIKGMEMPKNCDECFFVGRGFPDWCSLPQISKDEDEIDDTNNRPDWCPLEEVPETHDKRTETHACDLIERQAAIEAVLDLSVESRISWRDAVVDTLDALPPSPTVTVDTDTINRQAVIEALRTCYDTEAVTYTNGNEYISYDQALDLIGDLPSAQPEIIRCKDCKYSDTDNTLGVMFCWRVSYHEASEDGFCSWAERRTDDTD